MALYVPAFGDLYCASCADIYPKPVVTPLAPLPDQGGGDVVVQAPDQVITSCPSRWWLWLGLGIIFGHLMEK